MHRDPWTPLVGVAFVAVLIAGFVIGGEPPDADQPAQEVVAHYIDNKNSVQAGAIIEAVAAVLLIFFGAVVRRALATGPARESVLPNVAFAGTVVLAVGAAFDATLSFAMAETADDVAPASIHALQALWDNDFVPLALGIVTFLVGSGLAIVRYGAFPKVLGVLALLLAVVGLTPAGFIAFIGAGLYVIVLSVMLALRGREAPAPAE